jgi:hypothetical protein
MNLRLKEWRELTPFQQGYALGIIRVYSLAAGAGLVWWLTHT